MAQRPTMRHPDMAGVAPLGISQLDRVYRTVPATWITSVPKVWHALALRSPMPCSPGASYAWSASWATAKHLGAELNRVLGVY